MWWNDLIDTKRAVEALANRIDHMDMALVRLAEKIDKSDICQKIECLEEKMDDFFCSEDEFGSLNRIHDKLNVLMDDVTREERVELATRTLDKFEDYMKNVDKLNAMINEFKGCVSLARGALEERKRVAQNESETVNLMLKIAEILRKRDEKANKTSKRRRKRTNPAHRS